MRNKRNADHRTGAGDARVPGRRLAAAERRRRASDLPAEHAAIPRARRPTRSTRWCSRCSAIAGIIFVLVEVGVLWMVFRFKRGHDEVRRRRRAGAGPRQHGPRDRLDDRPGAHPRGARRVQRQHDPDDATTSATTRSTSLSIGQQWWWEYRYDTDDDGVVDIITATQLVIPAGSRREPLDPVQRRDPLLLDPGAQRQEGRGARVAPSRWCCRRTSRASSRASARSSAGSPTA